MTELRQREPREHSAKHLAFIKSQRCCIPGCTNLDTDPAHISIGCIEIGKRNTGGAEKAHDKWTLPLCRQHHDEQHSMAELAFWKKYGLDCFVLAARYWARSIAAGTAVISKARKTRMKPSGAKINSGKQFPNRKTNWPKRKFT